MHNRKNDETRPVDEIEQTVRKSSKQSTSRPGLCIDNDMSRRLRFDPADGRSDFCEKTLGCNNATLLIPSDGLRHIGFRLRGQSG